MPFVRLVVELLQWIQPKSCRRNDAAHPKFNEWGMLGINSEIVVPRIRDAGGDVIRLIEGESVEAGCNGRTQDCQRDQEQRK